jgi:hypothetical protein
MDHLTWRLAPILAALIPTSALTGPFRTKSQLAGGGRTRRSALREAQGNLSRCVADSGTIGKNKCSRIV